MHEEDLKDLKCVEEILEKDLRAEFKKVKDAGTFSPGQSKTINEAVELMLNMKELEEWLEGQGMSDMSRRSMARAYDYNSYRYPTNYSGHSTRDRMVSRLEDMMGDAKNEYEAGMIRDAINYIQRGESH